MGFETLALISLGLKVGQTVIQNKALADSSEAAINQSEAEIQEFDRQREEQDAVAAENKSDRVREADKQFASMITALADNGGSGTAAEARFAGEIGFHEGLDLARIEGNRTRGDEALKSRQGASKNRAVDFARGNRRKAVSNLIDLAASGAGTGTSIQGNRQRTEAVKQGGT